jgi:multidrug resistance protein, MATE family
MLSIMCISVSILWSFSHHIMIAIGQSPEIAHDASKFLMYIIPALFAYAWSVCIQQWLYAQQKTSVVASISVLVALIHPVSNYLIVYHYGKGFLGAAVALSLSRSLEFILLAMYLFYSGILQATEFSWTSQCLSDWSAYMSLGAPNILMMSEWWASETVIFMSGLLPNPDTNISAMSIFQNMGAVCFMIPRGMDTAGCR